MAAGRDARAFADPWLAGVRGARPRAIKIAWIICLDQFRKLVFPYDAPPWGIREGLTNEAEFFELMAAHS